MKKFFVLTVLFALPIIAYLFFASGDNKFAKLPVLTEKVKDVSALQPLTGDSVISFQDKITIVAFFGEELDNIKSRTFNLDQKILEQYYGFNDFQFVIILPRGAQSKAKTFSKEFKTIGNPEKWKFLFAGKKEINAIFDSFETPHKLNNYYTPYVFIVDKQGNLRGRDDDEDYGKVYGYDSSSVADLSNKMNDDVKVILAEYRLALKKNSANREN